MKQTFVIGDIHGGFKALLQVLKRANVKHTDTLIFLGDLVDGWSGSFETVEYLLDLEKKQPCIFIKGNHDVWCQNWLENDNKDMTWLMHGGQETFESYALSTEEQRKNHLDFFQRMQYYYIDNSNRLFIHAGFSAETGPQQGKLNEDYTLDRSLWELALKSAKKEDKDLSDYPKRLKLFSEIFIGHTPTLHLESMEPLNALNVWNIDTGAAFFGKLTILNIETKTYWQSDVVKNLYPNELGRNG